jgi:hypothetical protein
MPLPGGAEPAAPRPTMLRASTGRWKPFSVNSPMGSTCTSSSTTPSSRPLIRICRLAASPHKRAARLLTVPIAA